MARSIKMFAHAKNYILNNAGNTAMIFALSIIPIVSVAGFAIDYQMTSMRKNKVQAVIDSGVLAGAREMQSGKTQQEITTAVSNYVDAQLDTIGKNFSCQGVVVSYADEGQDLTASIDCTQETMLMQIAGRDAVDFSVASTSTWGIGKLDVAFMFDVSGSMSSSNRMVYLKEAAQDAVDTLLPAEGGVGSEDVRISMVSYDHQFDAGDYFEEVTGLSPERTYTYQATVTQEQEYLYEGSCDSLSSSSDNCEKREVCTKFKGNGDCKKWKKQTICIPYGATQTNVDGDCEAEFEETITVNESKTINSTCVWERPGDHAFVDTAPANSSGVTLDDDDAWSTIPVEPNEVIYNASDNDDNTEGYMAAGYAVYDLDSGDDPDEGDWDTEGTSCNPHTPLPLTDSRTDLTNYINSLTTNGATAGQQGIAWAWYTVAEPWNTIFTGDAAPLDYDEPDAAKAIILMTDGSFNREEFDDLGDSFEQAESMCDAIKDDGEVVIYSVAFQAPDDGQDVLEYCASGPEYYFAPESGDELVDAYQAIATSISDLRVKY